MYSHIYKKMLNIKKIILLLINKCSKFNNLPYDHHNHQFIKSSSSSRRVDLDKQSRGEMRRHNELS